MAKKTNLGENRTRSSMPVFAVMALCGFFYAFGAWQRSGFGKGDRIADLINKQTDCSILSSMNYETHHGNDLGFVGSEPAEDFEPCSDDLVDHTPCQDQARAMKFQQESVVYRERNCPEDGERLRCLVPAPNGYVTPFPWPKSRDYVPYANAPFKSLTVEKAVQNWIRFEGNVFRFPGGGTQFPDGADAYIEQIASVVPLNNGMVHTILDTGCGVASFGAYLFKKNVTTMSFAPSDSHHPQVQFALERGVPAIIGVLGTIMLPYPSRSFDMAHCSHCLIPWTENDGMYMMEVDRVLRPGGYWVLSGPPINWRVNHKSWNRPEEEVEEEQRKIEEIANLLCWEKKHEKGDIAIWRKRENYKDCQKQNFQRTICEANRDVNIWYKKMESCVTPYPGISGVELKPFPERLNAVPYRISSGSVPGLSAETYLEENRQWKKHVNAYRRINKLLDTDRYRNVMDMNAGFGSFAAALESPRSWVMNVMPTIAEKDTLGVVYERGLIGIYHDWCEAFSTYPRTYDLIHANGVFSLYEDKCDPVLILLEMDRILRPEGAVIFRDQQEVLIKVRKIVRGMRWNTKIVDHEDGPLVTEKVLYAVKKYWVAGGGQKNSTSSELK